MCLFELQKTCSLFKVYYRSSAVPWADDYEGSRADQNSFFIVLAERDSKRIIVCVSLQQDDGNATETRRGRFLWLTV